MDNTPVIQVEHEDKTLKIYLDEIPLNPREDWENLGHMICFHSRYNLGDKHNFSDPSEFRQWWENQPGTGVLMELYLYDHSGITISTHPFSSRWDSGQIGWIYATMTDIIDWFPDWHVQENDSSYAIIKDGLPESLITRVKENLLREVSIYDQYIQGDVYGFVIEDQSGAEVDSCWGFFSSDWENNGIKEHLDNDLFQALISA